MTKHDRAEIGDSVWWWPDKDRSRTPCSAVVTAVTPFALNLCIHQPDTYNHICKDGVRHIDDTKDCSPQQLEGGVWDHSNKTKRLFALEAEQGSFLPSKK